MQDSQNPGPRSLESIRADFPALHHVQHRLGAGERTVCSTDCAGTYKVGADLAGNCIGHLVTISRDLPSKRRIFYLF